MPPANPMETRLGPGTRGHNTESSVSRPNTFAPSSRTDLWPGRVSATSVDPAPTVPVRCQPSPVVRFSTSRSVPGPVTVTTGHAGTSPVLTMVAAANTSDAPRTRGRNGNHVNAVESMVATSWDSVPSCQ